MASTGAFRGKRAKNVPISAEADFGHWVKELLAFLDGPQGRTMSQVVVNVEGMANSPADDAAGVLEGCIRGESRS
ncbi:hypothetical protein BT96DRAFT_930182, partial [Gymnopus androsaceus JB14]